MWPLRRRRRPRTKGELLLAQGTDALRRRRLSEAIELLRAALGEGVDTAPLRINLGTAYHLDGQHTAAIEQFEHAVKLAPNDVTPLLNAAAAHSALGHHDKAIETLEVALTINPTHRDLHFNLAVGYGRKGRMKEAIEALQKEIQLHPKSKHARQLLDDITRRIAEAAQRTEEEP